MSSRKQTYNRDIAARGRPKEQSKGSGKSILAVVEGKETERIYLLGVRDALQLSAVRVQVLHAEVTDPVNIVREAIRLRDEQAERAKQTETVVAFDEVWAVFDREEQNHPRREQMPAAKLLAQQKGIEVAVSIPSFEFWFLLHYRYTTSPFADGDAVIAALKKFLPDYKKETPPMRTLLDRIETAVEHSKRCRKHWGKCGGDCNPCSDIDRLIVSLNASAGPVFRLF